ncbi:MAG: PfkB family carbohydrate kinase [Treponema sp.]|nr:PfkB family carbohydrate kinase [Treponema sp.]
MSRIEESAGLLCIGNVIVDFFARGDRDFARRHGIDQSVQHLEYEALAAALRELPDKFSCSGGGAANVAKIAGLLGMEVCFMGAAGRSPDSGGLDERGRFFEAELSAAGVKTRLFPRNVPTGCCLILKLGEEGKSRGSAGEEETRIAAAPSAALKLDRQDIREEDIRRAGVVVIDGYLMERQDLVRQVLDLANRSGTAVALDLSSAAIARARAHEIVTYGRIYPLILFMNEDESTAFYETLSNREIGEGAEELEYFTEDMYRFFLGLTVNEIFPIVVVKRGKWGAVVFAGGNTLKSRTFAVHPHDSTGAGDAFCAAFVSAWLRGMPLLKCADLGNKTARLVLEAPGAQIAQKKLKGLRKILDH